MDLYRHKHAILFDLVLYVNILCSERKWNKRKKFKKKKSLSRSICPVFFFFFVVVFVRSKMISNDQELIQSDPTSCPQNQKGNN